MTSQKNFLLIILAVLMGVALVVYAISQRASMNGEPRTLNLSEFGIALEIPGTLRDLTYTTSDESGGGPGTVLHMKIKETCEIGAFFEIQKNAIKNSGTTWTEESLEEFSMPAGANPARVKEFTDFYLVFEPSQEPCSSDADEAQRETEKRLALWNSLVTAHYMSQ